MSERGVMQGGAGVASVRVWRAIFLSVAVCSLLLAGCQKREQEEPKTQQAAALQPAPALQSATICRSSTMLLHLVVAEQQGFFAGQGLAVSTKEFVIGRDALEGMFKGDCELATAAEPPVIEYALQRDDFRIISALQNSDNLSRIAVRGDRGIKTPADLRGKRIATVKGTAPHYFLKLFLDKYDLDLKELTIDFMKGDDLLAALVDGTVDAIAMTNKVIVQAQQALPNAVIMEAPGLCRNYYMLLATVDLLGKRPAVPVKVLQALAQAEDFIKQRPEEAQTIASHYQKVSPAELKQLWGMYYHRLSLEHAMLMGLEDTARWYVQQSDDSQRPVPNFIKLIAADPLRMVRPEVINLEK